MVPFVSGTLLAAAETNDGKLRLHQIYFWIGAALLLIQSIVLNQIKGNPDASTAPCRTEQLKGVFSELLHSKKFLGFGAG